MHAIRAARLFDGQAMVLVERPLLLVDNGKIRSVQSGAPSPPDGVPLTDLGDVTLLPGLIDVHVHLGFDASSDPVARMCADDNATLLLRMAHHARRALNAGITTVRDLGDRNYLAIALRDWYRAGHELGPEVIVAGPPITVTGGHCHFMGGEADGELAVRRGVRERVKRGVDVLKIMATGGMMTPGSNPLLPQFTTGELTAAAEEAHRLNRRITAHAHGTPGIARAIEAGVDGIEHCAFLTPDGPVPDPALIEQLARTRVAVCPTVGPGWERPRTPELAARYEARARLLEHMHRAGVNLVGGTDAGIAGVPHDSLPAGLRILARCGLSNAQALQAGTSIAADACGLAGRKGAITPGADADLLAVAGNPLDDLNALTRVAAVYRAGRPVGLGTFTADIR